MVTDESVPRRRGAGCPLGPALRRVDTPVCHRILRASVGGEK